MDNVGFLGQKTVQGTCDPRSDLNVVNTDGQ